MHLDLSVVMITCNEGDRLKRCLQSLPSGCEIILVDSRSHDDTVAIAEDFGARIFERPFSTYAEQRNWAAQKATRRWLLFLDADEELTEDFRACLPKICRGSQTGYRLSRQLIFMGRALRYGKSWDDPLRLVPAGTFHWEGLLHERLVPLTGGLKVPVLKIGRLMEGTAPALLHESYRSLADYYERLNRYTTLAVQSQTSLRWGQLSLLRRLGWVLRPWWEFFWRYVVLQGFRDGLAGYVFAFLSAHYVFAKNFKRLEWPL